MLDRKLAITSTLALSLTLAPAFARKKTPTPKTSVAAPAVAPMTEEQKTLHALNRLAFGPRPGDVDQIHKEGLSAWIDQQLHPESLPQNPILEAKLAPLDTLRMSSVEIVRHYPPAPIVKAMAEGKIPWPQDRETRMITERMARKYRDKLGLPADNQQPPTLESVTATLPADQRATFESGTPEQKIALINSLPLEQQYDLLSAMPQGQRLRLYAIASPELRRKLQKFSVGPQQLVTQDLQEAKILRAVYSNAQLEEVLDDFWFNHFNVYLDKGADRYLVGAYERDAIRPHVLGKFKDLLVATAESPAMLYYLDNFQSVGPDAPQPRNPMAKRTKKGLNENYGRELMELHTLGVDGGYTQKDVTEVARCFTGWTIREPRRGGGFEFNEKQHDRGEKIVLGQRIPAGGGIDDGYKVIDILVHHPSTARFISKSLATRFVSDAPPESLVTRMAETFTRTEGDLREVMRTMLTSPEFWAKDVYRAKIKSPFEMLASSLRATNADVDFAFALSQQMNQLGEPLYRKQEPTGYSNQSAEWMNSASLLGRMNFALNLTGNKVAGVKTIAPESGDASIIARTLLMTDLTPESRDVVEKGLANQLPNATGAVDANKLPASRPALIAGLTLGSPDFQRR